MEQSKTVILSLCSFLLALCVHFQSGACINVKLIVALPNLNNQQQTLLPYWERGQEILQGARLAEQQINNSSNSEVQLQIELMDVNNGQCSAAGVSNYYLLEEIIEWLTKNRDLDFAAVVGLHCNNEFQYFLQPASLNMTSSQQKFKSVHKELIEEMLQNQIKPAPSHLIEAMFKFVNMSNWQNIGIMTEVEDTYFSRTAEEVYNKAKSYTPQFNVTRYHQLPPHKHGVTLPANVSKITLLSTSLQTAEDILCQAQRKKMIWPQYVWILHSFLLQDVISTCASCYAGKNCFENTIIVRKKQTTSTYCNTFSNIKPSEQYYTENPHSITLHDLIVETVVKHSVHLNIPSNCSAPKPGAITVTQVRNSTEIPIAEILDDQILIIDGPGVNTLKISDEHDIQFIGAPTAYIVIYLLGVSVGLILVTSNLVCYIYFRNEPEVKASSFMLSILIFLGCYLLLVFTLMVLPVYQRVLEIPEKVLDAACYLNPWISGSSMAGTLTYATVLMKIVRVYHIIKRSSRTAKPLGKMVSDHALFGYILLLLLPNLIIVVIWTAIDRLKIAYDSSFMPGFTQKRCISNYLIAWVTLLHLYLIVLYSIVVVVAISSRKIRDKHFKDSKWLNMFILFSILSNIVSLSTWILLKVYTSVPDYIALIPAYVGHVAGACFTQLLLITPKILPPFKRFIHSRKSFVKQSLPQTTKIYSTKHSLY